jgi:2,3-bisphosphoglycerate-dependent phosphoglycerate mutase
VQIILARHGQTTANAEKRFQGHLDCPLNETGIRQAASLAPLLAGLNPRKLFTSDLSRSIETARPAASLMGLKPIVSPLFREYSWGVLEGLSWPDIKERYPALFSRLRYDMRGAEIPGQEPQAAFRHRLQQGMELLTADKKAPTVALIGHGRFLNAFTVEFLGLDFDGPWPFSFDSAAVTVLEDKGGRRRLLRFNDKCHLTEDEYA